jgi:hypothetical protein
MWIKRGCIFNIEKSQILGSSTHAQVPAPFVMHDRIRVYYAARFNGKAFVQYFDLAFDLKTILGHSHHMVLEIGKPGAFDADGIMPSCIIKEGDEIWMYYIGWSKLSGEHARYQNEIGIAVSRDEGETFERMFEGPVMGRLPTEPGLAVMPFVMFKNWFRMWYQSGTGWTEVGEQYEPLYVIKYAESVDGVKWDRLPNICIESNFLLEAFSRPSIFFDEKLGIYNMWFCYRDSEDYRGGNGSYRIGKAVSSDGIKWQRNKYIFPLGKEGEWDSEMTCYPYIIEVNGKLTMFYNGNGFGQSGIGIATWEEIH